MLDYKIGIIADVHAGSRYAVFPEDFVTKEGNELRINEGQRQILNSWNDFVSKLKSRNINALFLLGDMVQGKNPKEFGIDLMTPDLDEQKSAVYELLSPFEKDIREGKITLAVVSGSGYHEAGDTRIHKDITNYLTGIQDAPSFYGLVANLQIRSKILNIQHGSSNAYMYRSSIMEREEIFTRVAEAEGRLPHIDAYIKGHWHRFEVLKTAHMLMLQVPGWSAFIPWRGAMKGYARFQPDIGGCVLTITGYNDMVVEEFLYPCPNIADAVKGIE